MLVGPGRSMENTTQQICVSCVVCVSYSMRMVNGVGLLLDRIGNNSLGSEGDGRRIGSGQTKKRDEKRDTDVG